MMAYAVPGFLFVKTKTLSVSHIPPFSKLLVYVCQPCLELYAFQSADFTPKLLAEMGWFFLLCTGVQAGMILLFSIAFRFDWAQVRRRVAAAAGVFGNVGFLGIPLLQALLPEPVRADGVALSAVFALSMNLFAWTAGLYLMTGERKHIRVKALLTNPAILAFYLAFPLFLLGWRLPDAVLDTVSLAGKMSTPICMTVLGMRLAATPWKRIISDRCAWLACAGKLIVMPLLAFAVSAFLPLPSYLRATLFLLCCCPSASVVQNFSELYLPDDAVDGKRTAADAILLSNILCMATIPLLSLLVTL